MTSDRLPYTDRQPVTLRPAYVVCPQCGATPAFDEGESLTFTTRVWLRCRRCPHVYELACD